MGTEEGVVAHLTGWAGDFCLGLGLVDLTSTFYYTLLFRFFIRPMIFRKRNSIFPSRRRKNSSSIPHINNITFLPNNNNTISTTPTSIKSIPLRLLLHSINKKLLRSKESIINCFNRICGEAIFLNYKLM